MTFLELFTIFHTALSLVAIAAGILVVKGLISSSGRQLWTLLFLVTAAATTITGFMFPITKLTPALILGVISIVPITLAILARYRYALAGSWRGTYVISAVVTLYFNCFVLVVQVFPAQSEPPFLIAQLITLAACIVAGVLSFRNYSLKTLESNVGYISPRPETD